MGICRYLNWLLGLAAASIAMPELLLALPVLFYTGGVTALSRIETVGGEKRPVLAAAAWLALSGLAILGLHAASVQTAHLALVPLALLAAFLGARLVATFRTPTAPRLQASVRLMLMGMIPLDAVLVAGNGQWAAALGLLLLLPPGRFLARWLYVT
jgi:4-hydroxybenzoate polyprenyltransferase